ncbi:MAG: chromosomal replication initiator protein DnaA, partial [Deltaproteobacteria bacterium]|nr:chromosomal replication initiator protein DnaA [Deltaproteobacteria bacterium]
TIDDLVSSSRKQAIVRPRQIAIYLARKYTDQPLQAIGKSFNRYHATALHSIGAVEREMKESGSTREQVKYLSKKLDSGNF